MTKQEFIDEAIIAIAVSNIDAGINNWAESALEIAEQLAVVREKYYGAFDAEPTELPNPPAPDGIQKAAEIVEKLATDPYAVDWSEAPEWANWHAVDEDGEKQWLEGKPTALDHIWQWVVGTKGIYIEGHALNNPDWKTSLRERPKTK